LNQPQRGYALPSVQGPDKPSLPKVRPLNNTQITRRTAQAVGWLAFSRLAAKGLDFCLLLILGRALLPADFGLVALAMTLVVMLDAISELPIGQAIVTMRNPSEEHYDTAFTLAMIRAIVLGSACTLLAWPFARFYNDQRLIGLIVVLSVAFMSRGLISPKLAQFARTLDFRRNFIIDFAGKLASLIFAGYFALAYRSYWAIATGTVTYWLTTVIACWREADFGGAPFETIAYRSVKEQCR
jgi:O-antigen/teichoic acid export membrane protein